MTALNWYILRKSRVGCHQRVLKFKLSLAIAQRTLDCFTPNFKLKYEEVENVKSDRVNTVVFNLRRIKRRAFFWNTRYMSEIFDILGLQRRQRKF